MITYLDKPWFLVLILLVHVQLDQVYIQIEGLDTHQNGSAVGRSWYINNVDGAFWVIYLEKKLSGQTLFTLYTPQITRTWSVIKLYARPTHVVKNLLKIYFCIFCKFVFIGT